MKDANKTINALQQVLDLNDKDINKTWLSILKTHIKTISSTGGKEDFSDDVIFQPAGVLEFDLLDSTTVGEVGVLYEYSLAYVDRDSRKERGQFFTPDDVATFMASKNRLFPEGVWLDPCSGVGNLSAALLEAQEDPEHFLLNNLILQDIDSLALLIARTLFALKYQHAEEKFFDKIEPKFVVKNFLEEEPEPHNYVIVNPPYLATTMNSKFKTAKTRDLYAYFLEKISDTSEGVISITPQSYLNSGKFDVLREILFSTYQEIDFYAFDNMPDTIFKGFKYGSLNTNTSNSVRASIMVAKRSDAKKYRSTGMLRWVAAERPILFTQVDSQLEEFKIKNKSQLIPKIGEGLSNFYADTTQISSLFKDLLSTSQTEYKLIVPATPRYFISAVKRELNRSSYHTLCFDTKKNMETAYLLLNSSYMYWWWRVNDGGMTVAKQTILSLPLRSIDLSSKESLTLIEALEQSETDNLVVKKNAGLLNENVRHPESLIHRLNRHLFSEEVSNLLLKVHRNSFVSPLDVVPE